MSARQVVRREKWQDHIRSRRALASPTKGAARIWHPTHSLISGVRGRFDLLSRSVLLFPPRLRQALPRGEPSDQSRDSKCGKRPGFPTRLGTSRRAKRTESRRSRLHPAIGQSCVEGRPNRDSKYGRCENRLQPRAVRPGKTPHFLIHVCSPQIGGLVCPFRHPTGEWFHHRWPIGDGAYSVRR